LRQPTLVALVAHGDPGDETINASGFRPFESGVLQIDVVHDGAWLAVAAWL
jgi:hypothetical protein